MKNKIRPAIFDGKKFAAEKEAKIKLKIKNLKTTPKLASILIGNNPASILYTNLKQKAAKRVGVQFTIYNLESTTKPQEVINLIKKLNQDKTINGIMVQLPLPLEIENWKLKILESIDSSKDVDGLTKNSPFTPATVKAILEIINFSKSLVPNAYSLSPVFCVVGANGMVGKRLLTELKKRNYKVTGVDKEVKNFKFQIKNFDIVISATGRPNLIKPNMVKDGVIIIDVGSPLGDVDKSVYKKAKFVTPVPGGVGPVTISCLLENLIQSYA